ncbi:MAG: BamA/TamA family outer membrane protein [Candidatus Acidiferrales bacterium]
MRELKAGLLENPKAGRRSEPLIESVLRVLLLCVACFCVSLSCFGQENQHFEQLLGETGSQTMPDFLRIPALEAQSTAPTRANEPSQPEAEPKKKKKLGGRGAFVVAPLPISSPAIGSGIVPVLGYIFPFSTKDKVSPPSTVGVAGLITNNGSRGFVIGAQLFLKENTYQITSGYVRGNVDYNIYGNGIAAGLKLPLQQTGQAFLGEVLRRIGWKFFLGPRFITGNSFITIRPNDDMNFPIPPEAGLHTTLTSLGARLTRDTRPNHFYPLSGTYFTFVSDFFSQTLGSKYSFQSYRTEFDKYWSLGKAQVLAYDANFCATGGQPPFYGNCIYGTNNELRGYTAGRYFTRYTIATQFEYRLVLPKRFGLVVFGGLGGVIPAGSQLLQRVQGSHFLPSGGGGLRFELSKKYHVNLRADIAQGRDGHTFGMGVGEAF